MADGVSVAVACRTLEGMLYLYRLNFRESMAPPIETWRHAVVHFKIMPAALTTDRLCNKVWRTEIAFVSLLP